MTEETMPQIRSVIKLNSIGMEENSGLTKGKSFSMKKLCFKPISKTHIQPHHTPQKKQKQGPLTDRRGSRLMQLSKLKLSPIKQYETKLKISSESWLVFDYRRDSYKRGWKPSQIKEFNGMIRLVIFKVFIELLEYQPEIKDFQIRVNEKYLKEEIEGLRQSKRPPDKKHGVILEEAISRGLKDNIVIGIVDLIYGIFMTNYDDMVEYSIIFMGYLCHCHAQQVSPISQDSPCHFISTIAEATTYGKYFAEYVNGNLFPQMEMKQSSFQPKFNDFLSSANDICRLYLALEQNPFLKQILACKEKICQIKYQIGFRYWENRTLHLKNRRVFLGQKYTTIFHWKSRKNYSVISKNSHLNILIILEDCKFGMAERDIYHVQQWVKAMMKPIVDHRKTHKKMLPNLRPLQHHSPQEKKGQKMVKVQKQHNK